jgi:hypothetical protein
MIGVLVIFGVVVVWRLPMFCSERWHCVRYLPLLGLCYYIPLVLLVTLAFALVWWEIVFAVTLVIVGGVWLLPDPVTFLLYPTRRRAVVRAIEQVEAEGYLSVNYGMVWVIGAEPGRQIVVLSELDGMRPPGRRFFAVSDDGTVEELDYEYVADALGVRPRF